MTAAQSRAQSRAIVKQLVASMPAQFKHSSSIARSLVARLNAKPHANPAYAKFIKAHAATNGQNCSTQPANCVSIAEYPAPPATVPIDIKNGPDGNVWFSYPLGMGRINAITKKITLFPGPLSEGVPYAVNGGPGPYMYFTSLGVSGLTGNDIGRINVYTGKYDLFPIPTPFAYPADLKTGADGNIWFTEGQGIVVGALGKVGVFNVTTHAFHEIVTGLGTTPQDVATGEGSCQVFRHCPTTETTPSTSASTPGGINTPGGPVSDGLVYYTLMGPNDVGGRFGAIGLGGPLELPAIDPLNQGNAIFTVNPFTYQTHTYHYPTAAAETLDVDPGPTNQTVWFDEYAPTANKAGYISTVTHKITELPQEPDAASLDFTIGTGPRGVTPSPAMFALQQAPDVNSVDMITDPGGANVQTEIPIPTAASLPIDLTQNCLSKSVFFAEALGNNIAEIRFPQSTPIGATQASAPNTCAGFAH